MGLFETGVRPAIDAYLQKKSEEERDYGEYWSASSGGYCMRKLIFERLKVPHVKEQDARKTRVFEAGHIFHQFLQDITREAGISVAQEVRLQDEDLMVRGHFDDLVLIKKVGGEAYTYPGHPDVPLIKNLEVEEHLILYDYKTQNSRAFTYQKNKPMSHYHRMQLGTYMYMIRKLGATHKWREAGFPEYDGKTFRYKEHDIRSLTEGRILKISKDDLRMTEDQLLWTPELEKDVYQFWSTLNGYWKAKTIPKCTCADHEGGFLAREAYNDFFYEGEPCSLDWYKLKKTEGLVV